MRVALVSSWRGGQLDRLLDEGHAAVGGACSTLLSGNGWQVLSEVTYSVFGERGSIDLLAWHAGTRTLLVVEVKTEITSAEEMLRRHDAKVRLAPRLGRERFGQTPAAVVRLLVVADTTANRTRVARLAPLLGPRYPVRGRELRAWLKQPTAVQGGILFLSTGIAGASRTLRQRVRTRHVVGTGGVGVSARTHG